MASSRTDIPRWLAAAILVIGLSVFAARGPYRMMSAMLNGDSRLVTVAARVWAHGQNPYDTQEIARAWTEAGGAKELDQSWRGAQAFVYPPSAYVLAAPLGLAPPEVARHLWNLLAVSCFIFGLLATIRLAGIRLRSSWGALALGLGLAMAPSHTNIALGQTTVFVFAAVVGGIILRERKAPWLAGASLGLACAIKPQTGLVYVGYELGRGRWKVVLAAAWVFAMLMLCGVVRTWLAGFDGLGAWLANSRELLEHDANPIAPGIYAHRLIDLASPIAVVLNDVSKARVVAFGVMAAAALAYAIIDLRRGGAAGEGKPELLSTSAVSVVMLLVCYHRLYDAVFLIFPLMLGLAWLRAADRRGWLTLLLAAPFFVPGASMLTIAAEHGYIPAALAGKIWWQVCVVQHQTWALCVLLAWLTWLRWRLPRVDLSVA